MPEGLTTGGHVQKTNKTEPAKEGRHSLVTSPSGPPLARFPGTGGWRAELGQRVPERPLLPLSTSVASSRQLTIVRPQLPHL